MIKKSDRGWTIVPRVGEVQKSSKYVHAIGDVEELNAHLGKIENTYNHIDFVRHEMMNIIHKVVDLRNQVHGNARGKELIREKDVEHLEHLITTMEEVVGIVRHTLLPTFAHDIQIAMTISRRAERSCTEAIPLDGSSRFVVAYLNRLSKFLSVLARYVNHVLEEYDEIRH